MASEHLDGTLIAETGASGVLFVSGDRHLMEISRDVTRNAPYPLWDFTSSGLNIVFGGP